MRTSTSNQDYYEKSVDNMVTTKPHHRPIQKTYNLAEHNKHKGDLVPANKNIKSKEQKKVNQLIKEKICEDMASNR